MPTRKSQRRASTAATSTKTESAAILKELLADLDVRLDQYEQYLVDEMVKQAGGLSVQTAAKKARQTDANVWAFQHDARFENTKDLADFLTHTLRAQQGKYYVVTARLYRSLMPGDRVVFHKSRQFVGEAKLKQGLIEPSDRPRDREFEGFLTFDLKSIRKYRPPLPFPEIEAVIGRTIGHRRPSRLGNIYDIIAGLRSPLITP